MITADKFEEKLGYPPKNDDLDRINCPYIGELAHMSCGWCLKHDKPRFICGCLVGIIPNKIANNH